MRGNYLTINAIIRFNQIEARPDLHIGEDESGMHSVASVENFRNAVAKGFPGGRITWAFTWKALQSELPQYAAIRQRVRAFALQYGDDVTYNPGAYFANAYSTRGEVNLELDGGIAMLRGFMGEEYTPKSVVAGFLSAENQRHLAEKWGVHVCQGNIWSQYAIDNQDGDGSVCYPYYPSKEHFCKPAQGAADFIDCVNLDGWTVDFLAGRHKGHGEYSSRTGAGPIETLLFRGALDGMRILQSTTHLHFEENRIHNDFGWVTASWENCLEYHSAQYGYGAGAFLGKLTEWLQWVRRQWPAAQMPTLGEFGLQWRNAHPCNDFAYRFDEDGTPESGSDADLHIRWYMRPQFRLALLWPKKSPEQVRVIDFTRYDLPAKEPKSPVRNWSLLGDINQKQTRPQDQPLRVADCGEEIKRALRAVGYFETC